MAKINPTKVRQDADKEEKAGRFDKAIELYKQLVADSPRDWNTIKKVGDLYARINRNKEASLEYAKVADFYARDGFLLKAIAVWKQIQKLDPAALDAYLHLADLYAKQGLMVEAKGQYQTVVDEYKKRGKIKEAGEVLGKIAEIDPDDLKVQSLLADLYVRNGNAQKAIEVHIAIADTLNKKGHLAEALQVLEKGLKIDAKSGKLRAELARVHLLQKNWDKAVQVLEEAIRQTPNDPDVQLKLGEAYLGAKKIEEAEEIFRRLLQQDPQGQEARIQMARVKLFKGRFDEAFDQLLPVVDRFVEKKEGDKAAALLQQIVQRNEAHVKSLVKLVEVYRALRKESAVAATYQQLSEAYIREGQMEQAASVLEILVEMDPQNGQHRSKLDFVRDKSGATATDAPSSNRNFVQSATGEFFEEDLELEPPALDAEAGPATPPPAAVRPAAARPPAGRGPARPAIELSSPPSGEDKEFIDEHLAEGRVFRKYGLQDKAADQFLAVVSRFPDHLEARQELRDVYKDKGEKEKAAEQSLALSEISRLKGDAAGAMQHAADAQALDPQAAPAEAVAEEASPLEFEPVPDAEAETEPPPEPEPTSVADAEGEAETEIDLAGASAEEEIPLEVEEGGLEAPEEPLPDIGPLDLEEPGASDEQGLTGGFIDEEAAPSDDLDLSLTDPAPAPEEEELSFGGPVALDLEDEPAVPEPPPPPARPVPPPRKPVAARPPAAAKPAPLPPRPSRIQPRPAAARPAPPPSLAARKAGTAKTPPLSPKGVPPELKRALDEVEQYVSLGFVDDARDALRDIASRFADHPAVMAKMAELGLEASLPAAAPEPPSRAPAPAGRQRQAPAPPPPPRAVPEPAPADQEEDELANLVGDIPDEAAPASSPEPEPEGMAMAPEDPFGDLGLEEPAPPAEDENPFGDSFEEPSSSPPEPDLGDLGDDPFEEPSPPVAAPPEDGGGLLDLGAELDGLFETQSAVAEPEAKAAETELGDAGLADIFKEFKKGVDKQLGKEDYDTRYNLGIAYKEMGLVDEAIAEFQLAARDERRMLECSSMLGICFLEKGMAKLAVKWFEKGLLAPGRSDEEYQGLRYDLAMAHEAAGDPEEALHLYTDLYGQDATFRDVANKVRELRAALR